MYSWETVKPLSVLILRIILTGICQVDLILLGGRRREAPRVPALSIFCDSGITRFMVSLDLFTQPIFEAELLDDLIT